jgi:hypothetical protein
MDVVLAVLTALLVVAAYGHLVLVLRAAGRPDLETRPRPASSRVLNERRAIDLCLIAATLLALGWSAYLIGRSHGSEMVYQAIASATSSGALLMALAAWFSWRRANQLWRIPVAAVLVAASGILLMLMI